MSGTVGDIGNEVKVCAFGTTEQTIHSLNDGLDDVYILPLVESTDVVCLGDDTFMIYNIDRARVVLDEQPVTYVLTLAVHRKGFAMTNIIDEQRNEFLRELVRTIVVRAVRHDGRHAVGIMEGTYEMIRRCFRC